MRLEDIPEGKYCTDKEALLAYAVWVSERLEGTATREEITECPHCGRPAILVDFIYHKGAFFVDFAWIWEGTGTALEPTHNHEWPELIAMVGADPEHPRDMGGPMSIVLGDETHVLEKSCFVCIPKGLNHCPWKFLDIKKPTLVFTARPSATYSGSHEKD